MRHLQRTLYDHNGETTGAKHIYYPITPAQFDAEIALSADDHVRPLMTQLGDSRDGTALLADLPKDWENQRIKKLVKTRTGRCVLDRLAQVARRKLSGLFGMASYAAAHMAALQV